MSDKNRWFAFYSAFAVKSGCPVATYKDKNGKEIQVTGVSPSRNGMGYTWSDKVFVGEVTDCKSTRSTYRPHPDFYRYWW
jgi:hypothetical protein